MKKFIALAVLALCFTSAHADWAEVTDGTITKFRIYSTTSAWSQTYSMVTLSTSHPFCGSNFWISASDTLLSSLILAKKMSGQKISFTAESMTGARETAICKILHAY